MKQSFYLLIGAGLVLASCARSWESEKEEFITSCEKSYIESFKNALEPEVLNQIDLNNLDDLATQQCDCLYNAIKDKYETPEEAYSKGIDAVMEEVSGCDPKEEELDKLFK